jgi:RNA polymerase sigma-70 factor (ECF subfamily)
MNDTRLSSDSSVRSPDLTVTVTPALVPPSWSRLVQRVREAEPAALEELYELFSKGIRFYLWRHLGPQDLDDRVHDAFLVVTQLIQSGELREPERLMGFVHTIVRRQVASQIDDAAHARRSHFSQDALATLHDRHIGPEEAAIRSQQQELAMRILRSIPGRDREVLVRFYLREQNPEQICHELDLSESQFRLIKSRAKARFGELGKARMAQRTGFLTKVK